MKQPYMQKNWQSCDKVEWGKGECDILFEWPRV